MADVNDVEKVGENSPFGASRKTDPEKNSLLISSLGGGEASISPGGSSVWRRVSMECPVACQVAKPSYDGLKNKYSKTHTPCRLSQSEYALITLLSIEFVVKENGRAALYCGQRHLERPYTRVVILNRTFLSGHRISLSHSNIGRNAKNEDKKGQCFLHKRHF